MGGREIFRSPLENIMCGILGVFGPQAKDYHLNDAMSSFKHRGPDEQFLFQNPFFCAGVNRLAVNDIHGGIQPFFGADKNTAVVYNGEIYNHLEIRKILKSKSLKVIDAVDGAVLPALYEVYGDSFTKELDGMFAIALYDKKYKKLILSRDTAGEKPLYYCSVGSNVVFSSDLSAFGSILSTGLNLNMQAIWDYASFLWVPEPLTIYDGVHCLLPGETAVFYLDKRPTFMIHEHAPKNDLPQSSDELSEFLGVALQSNIESCLMADVPIGTFLSGGLDSSIVTATSAKKISGLHTFSIAFEDGTDPYHGALNEAHFARELSKFLGTSHHEILMSSNLGLKLLDDFVSLAGQPFAVSSGIGILAISELARDLGIKVLLSGDGADELFAGYSWYAYLHDIFNLRKGDLRRQPLTLTMQDVGIGIESRIETISSYSDNDLLFALHYYGTEDEKNLLFSRQWHADNHFLPSSRMLNPLGLEDLNPLAVIDLDRRFYLSQEMLRKVDLFTMAKSVEGRVPFVRKEIFQIAQGLKENFLFDKHALKKILRSSVKNLLPAKVIARPKHGFNFPIDEWLRHEWRFLLYETFSTDSELYRHGMINKGSLNSALSMIDSRTKLNGHTIFTFVILERFLREKRSTVNCGH